MENKSDLLTADLPVAPSLEQRTQDKQCHTESIFQSSPPKMDVIPDRFKPIRNASFQSLSTVTDSKSISSSSSVKDFTSRQDSKIGQINVYEPLLDPKLQNDNGDSQVDTATEEEYQGKHNPVQAAENEPDVFQGKDVQPVFHPVEKDMVQTNIKTSPITPANIIKKQLINDQHSDKMTIKSKMAKITDIKLAYGKFTNTCYLAKTWLKVAFNTKSKQDDSKVRTLIFFLLI
jgi:hypothetical protein